MSDADETKMGDDATRMVAPGSAPVPPRTSSNPLSATSGWLTSSGSIDHGRFAPGTIVDDRYRVIGLLGRGGMGEVFRADDLRLGQPVALKFLPEALGRDPIRLAQFHNEVRTARHVSHTNVCRMYDIGELGEQLFLTMEYVDGEDLSSLLRRIGRLPEDKALEIARQICAGLSAAHERGVLHRDLKPANIMLDSAGKVRIMDFSLAAIGAVTDIRAGTPAYMAPEQLQGREVTVRSDIYALGLVLYELFTGRRAFEAKTLGDLIAQHESGSITAPTEIVKSLDQMIERAILRCLDPDPARRPASALAVSASLPGGDPLAAALAAGETPSPEMVAAAGGEHAALSPLLALAWSAAVIGLLVVGAILADRVSLFAKIPFEKSADVLEDRAEGVRQLFGYTTPPVDRATGYSYNGEYRAWATKNGRPATHWAELASGRTAPLTFWYRTSPAPLLPVNLTSMVVSSDPPFIVTGMTLIEIDTKGRLVLFEAMPPEAEPKEAASSTPFDWRSAFTAAGLDAATFTEVPSARTPRMFADERHAWRGSLPETDATVTIEAASYRGKPVWFEVVGPWTAAWRDLGESGDDGNNTFSVILVLVLLTGAAILTRINLKSGRADRRGAFRIAVFIFCVLEINWVFFPHVRSLDSERSRLFVGMGLSLFVAGALFLIYLALEPFVRKSWPKMLVSWSRALSGRLRDPLIGRDLLIGAACGLVLTLLTRVNLMVPHWLGWPEPFPEGPSATSMLSIRLLLVTIMGCVNIGLQTALINFLEFAVFREGVRRVAGWLKISRLPLDVMAAVAAIVCLTLFTMLDSQIGARHVWLPALYSECSFIVTLLVMLRLGLLASFAMNFVNVLTARLPLTFDSTRLYADRSWVAMAIVLVIAGVGLWMARAGEPLFGKRSAT